MDCFPHNVNFSDEMKSSFGENWCSAQKDTICTRNLFVKQPTNCLCYLLPDIYFGKIKIVWIEWSLKIWNAFNCCYALFSCVMHLPEPGFSLIKNRSEGELQSFS